MAALSLPMRASSLLSEFGISTGRLSSLAPSSATSVAPAKGSAPGFVPSNARTAGGTLITSTNYKQISNFVNCFYVAGAVRIKIAERSFATVAALLATLSIDAVTGRITSTSISGDTITITSTWPLSGATSTITIKVNTVGMMSGSSTVLTFSSFQGTISNISANSGAWKLVGATSYGLEVTDSYSGWHEANSTVTLQGASSGGYRYITVFLRNRTA